jgi:hypothetical protein
MYRCVSICSQCKMKHLCATTQHCLAPLLSGHATATYNIIRRSRLKATLIRHKRILRQMEHGLKRCGGIWCRGYVA